MKTPFKEKELPRDDLRAIGLPIRDSDRQLDGELWESLLGGFRSPMLTLKNLSVNGLEIERLDARLSLRRREDGTVALMLHPIYKEAVKHGLLTEAEHKDLIEGRTPNVYKDTALSGKILRFGPDKYEFDPRGKESYFIELEKANGERKTVWGIDLERALKDSGFKEGDSVQLDFLGSKRVTVDVPVYNEQKEVTGYRQQEVDRHTWAVSPPEQRPRNTAQVFEYDPETREFIAFSPADVTAPDRVNGQPLTPEQKRRFRQGQEVQLPDDIRIRASAKEPKGINTNRVFMVASILLDGGISYVLVKGIQMIGKMFQDKQDRQKEYTQAYLDAVQSVERKLEQQLALHPGDETIAGELKLVRGEYARATGLSRDELKTIAADPGEELKKHLGIDPDMKQDNEESRGYTKTRSR